ncbi:RNA polymerase sigma-70 factor (ECF subfamily) [Crossiella equi]|uniref:RNA polymerase sigma factor n=1 Tax=Crossiella equi TaxID=130796 RepID=A0ABS5ALB9_9PSEU|nr:sigma-70 family RNA polymerase sigma factor [Crossiella equi]MBP2477341.1 RNA polymerase sigma-70 factor (ECF subfamily) [Crossiella equi]
MADDTQITEWALAAGRGDQLAAAAFIRATQREVWRFLTHLSGREEAEDLTQETFVRALRSLPRFAGRSQARTWLLSIARRVAVDHVRAAMARPRVSAGADWQETAERATAGLPGLDEGVSLQLAVRSLGPEQRAAFVLTQVLGLGYAEAAQVCECPVGTIRSRVARARQELVQALGEHGRHRPAASE